MSVSATGVKFLQDCRLSYPVGPRPNGGLLDGG